MVTIPLGTQAYKREYAGEPEIKLVNRFLEVDPTNLREKITLLSRSGSGALTVFPSDSDAPGQNRGQFSKVGLFNGDLFGVGGGNLYRYAADGTKIHILGLVNGTGFITYAWMKGPGYEYLFIADGLLLQVYAGGSHATGTLTKSGAIDTSQIIEIQGGHYAWNDAVDTNAPDGSLAHPWLAKLTGDALANMATLLNFSGVRGVDYSTALGGPNLFVTATSDATHLHVTAITDRATANAFTTTVPTGAGIAWGAATLAGGGTHVLQGVEMPDGSPPLALSALSGYVLISVGGTYRFYWLEPGTIVIDALNFASKESNPDPIVDMTTVGDQCIISGTGSTENWYATGNFDAPFAPQEGRVYRRGAVEGTHVAVNDALIFVGDDGVVYSVGYGYGDTSSYGVHRISTHAIEERIRITLRAEEGAP